MIAMLLLSLAAHAQVIDIDINGRPYTCTPRTVSTPMDCVEAAYRGPFTREESERLCSGARSSAPADCAIRAYSGPFTRDESIRLCTRAFSIGPADCALKAYAGPFTRDESLQLCASPRSSVATADCAIRAYSGSYTREQALRMCAGASAQEKTVLLSKEDSEALLIEATQKSLREGNYKR
jgi:hypothetical protein